MAKWPYSTRRWRRLRLAVLRAEPLCAECLRQGRLVPATQVDHIVPISRGGAVWDPDNLQPLCASCHSRKTDLQDGGGWAPARNRSVDPATGRPLDPEHWWNKQDACQDDGGEGKSSQPFPADRRAHSSSHKTQNPREVTTDA